MDLAQIDQEFCWHPFTQMGDWCGDGYRPLVIVRGEGAMLFDGAGGRYLDGNSSIWTNVHGHSHPKIVGAIAEQAARLAHVSFLGTTNVPAALLAQRLVGLCASGGSPVLRKVFYSDDGSTAIECALRMALQFRQLTGEPERRVLVAFDRAYHGDTLGAASIGGVPAFQRGLGSAGFEVVRVGAFSDLEALPESVVRRVAAVIVEPLIQGAAGMRLWPGGMLGGLRSWCDRTGAHLIFDEVMTGFGRTGRMFAFQHEGVTPDFVAMAKGLTGGTLPLAATLTTKAVFDAFVGDYSERKTFFYGHSYSGNPLGCAAALANLEVFEEEDTLARLQPKIARLSGMLAELAEAESHVGEVRQCGFIAGIDLVPDSESDAVFDWRDQVGARVCEAARRHGLLTRPVLDTLVLMPPLCTTEAELEVALGAIRRAIGEVLGS